MLKVNYPNRKNELVISEKEYLMFIDIETIGTLNVIESCLPFEIGMKIYNTKTENIEIEKSYLVRRFFNNKYIMNCTFSASKYPTYKEKLDNDKRYKLYSANEISKDLINIMRKYNIDTMVAHNGKFDYTMMSAYFNEFEVENPFENINVLDTMELSKNITMSVDYENWCLSNIDITSVKNGKVESDFITNSGRVRTTAQAIYSYLTKNPNFQEAHTGLEDIAIEIEIFKASAKSQTSVCLNTAPTWRDYKVVFEKEN